MIQKNSIMRFLADLAGFLITLAFGLLMAAAIVAGGVLFFIACK